MNWLKHGFLLFQKWFYFWFLLTLRSSLSTIKTENTSQWFLNCNCYLWSVERLLKVHLSFLFSQLPLTNHYLLQEKNTAKDQCHFSVLPFSLRICPFMFMLLWYLSNYFKHFFPIFSSNILVWESSDIKKTLKYFTWTATYP